MTGFDYAVLAIVLASMIISVIRGAIREIASLVSWVVAFIIANSLTQSFTPWVPAAVSDPSWRYLITFATLFILIVIVLELVGLLIAKLFHAVGLSFLDRSVGALFGLARGVLVVLLLVLLAGLTNLPRAQWWQEAALSPPLEIAVLALRPWLPLGLAKRLQYSPPQPTKQLVNREG